jgi:hypothetical protein
MVELIADGLEELYRGAITEEHQKDVEAFVALQQTWPPSLRAQLPTLDQPFAPALTDYIFQSNLPIIGPAIGALRTFWYNMSARWGVQHLRAQQEVINRQHALYIAVLQRQVQQLVAQNRVLTQEIARLSDIHRQPPDT